MKIRSAILFAAVTGGALWLRAAEDRVAPGLPASVKDLRASEFSSEQYFDPPNETKIKMRFSGASVSPLPGGTLQQINQMRIETFGTNGVTRVVAEAPQCELSPFNGVASSAGRLTMQSGDGKFRMESDGFLWQQNEKVLTFSNNVVTTLKIGTNSFDSFIKL